jgi:hypothetical protein
MDRGSIFELAGNRRQALLLMPSESEVTRRGWMTLAGAAGSIALTGAISAEARPAEAVPGPAEKIRIGVISAGIRGAPQKTNGHTWHFTNGFHPTMNLEVVKKYLFPGAKDLFEKQLRNPQWNFDLLPFADTRIAQVYDADPASAAMFAEAFEGVRVARSLEEMVKEVDAVWLGDASGFGEDHFDLVAPGLARGLPTFCDKPIGGSVAGTKKILDFASEHNAPLMSSSLFRHQWGTEQALRMKASGEFGSLQYIVASQGGGWSMDRWAVYGQHPTWMVMTLCGPGVEAVSLYARENVCHALVTYADRMPAEIWCGAARHRAVLLLDLGALRKENLRMDAGHRGQLLARPRLPDFPHGQHVPPDGPHAPGTRSTQRDSGSHRDHPRWQQVAAGKEPPGAAGGSDGLNESCLPRPVTTTVPAQNQ